MQRRLVDLRGRLAELMEHQRAFIPGSKRAEMDEIKKQQNAARAEQRKIVLRLEQLDAECGLYD